MADHDEPTDEAHDEAPVDDLHGAGAGPPVAAPDDDPDERLVAMPSLIETVTPAQMAMTIHTHMKELYAVTYDREGNRYKGDVNKCLDIACNMLLIAFDDRRVSMAMAKAADDNDLFNSFDAARDFSLQGKA